MTDSVVQVTGLTHDYGEVVALKNLDIEIPAGITGLVGANGAGKTTLLRILLGLIHPTEGNAYVLGHDSENEPLEVRSRVGYMPEGECIPDDLTAAEFVAYTAQLAGLPKSESKRRASETLFLVGLAEERFRFLGDFSTGMKQRVKLAQALVHDPDLILLDEPASGLDPKGRDQMLALIRRLGELGLNIVMSSHVLTDIEQTCEWVVMLDGGNLLKSGPLGGFDRQSTVLLEVIENAEAVAARLAAEGIASLVDQSRLVVGPGDAMLETRIISAVATENAGLIRMIRSSASLEDLFMEGSPVD
ncbi:MAG: ABC transporter ATP-binding protein [Acidimicrobiia bacterium]